MRKSHGFVEIGYSCQLIEIVIDSLHKTVNDKELAFFGFAFEASAVETRESWAKYICL